MLVCDVGLSFTADQYSMTSVCYYSFMHSPVGLLGCFSSWTVTDKAAVTVHVQVFERLLFSSLLEIPGAASRACDRSVYDCPGTCPAFSGGLPPWSLLCPWLPRTAGQCWVRLGMSLVWTRIYWGPRRPGGFSVTSCTHVALHTHYVAKHLFQSLARFWLGCPLMLSMESGVQVSCLMHVL